LDTTKADGLLEKILDSLIKLDLLVFFHRNPDTMDSASGIATWVGHDERYVARELAALAEAQLLVRHGEGPDAIYTRTTDPHLLQKVEDFMEAVYFKRENRLKLIAEILQREERG